MSFVLICSRVSFGIPLHVVWLTPNHLLEFRSGSLVFAISLCPSLSRARYHLLRGSSTSGADDGLELLRRLQVPSPSYFDYMDLVEQEVDPLRTQERWPRACYALGLAGSSSRYVSVWLVWFLPRIDLWFSDCYLFMVLSWIHFGLVLCVFEPMYLLSASFA